MVCERGFAYQAGFDAARVTDEIQDAANAALQEAQGLLADLPGAQSRLVHGRPTDWLLKVAVESDADLIAIGSHQHRRAAGILLGSVATETLHRAPGSVLIARDRNDTYGTIVVGVDGSPESIEALTVARELAETQHVRVDAIAADEGKPVDRDALGPIVAEIRWAHTHPADALVDAAQRANLVVVGSRGLHGLRSLGSVSERVAHRAACSVLVIRAPQRPSSVDEMC